MSSLKVFVCVDGVLYGPGSDVPHDVAARITNPDAWNEPPAASEPADKQVAPPRRRSAPKSLGD